jgi:hypothetical protein
MSPPYGLLNCCGFALGLREGGKTEFGRLYALRPSLPRGVNITDRWLSFSESFIMPFQC